MTITRAEEKRLREEHLRTKNWKRWGTYLPERQWGTVREDYSQDGSCWDFFPHDHARSRAYRWGEDGLFGWTDRECRLCFAPALWNGADEILKERLYGLTGPEGNHGEDVKELYYYLDATPTHSYAKALYKYPHAKFPYQEILNENQLRGLAGREYELIDTGIFDAQDYFDVQIEYGKASPNDTLIKITVKNCSAREASITILPQLWFRNTWRWVYTYKEITDKPVLRAESPGVIVAQHQTLGTYKYFFETKYLSDVLFTDNETNPALYSLPREQNSFYKDAFHRHIISGEKDCVNPAKAGTKCAPVYTLTIPGGESRSIRQRLAHVDEIPLVVFGRKSFDRTLQQRSAEAEEFYDAVFTKKERSSTRPLTSSEKNVTRQAWAGLLWTKQFYYYVVDNWLTTGREGPGKQGPIRPSKGRNAEWRHLFSRDVISMPDKWEYPWFAAWDLAFHMIPFCRIDPDFAKHQLTLFLREWYLHPNGQIPAYEFAFSDVNPPVHAWAVFRVYKMTAERGKRDTAFLEGAYQKLLMNFTWWVNRKDPEGNNLFSGGFLGMDNIGVFDRSKPLPTGGYLQQADGTAWMAFYCLTMLSISLELAKTNPVYEDMASKFFEHYLGIADSINHFNGTGLWNEHDGFYYDQLRIGQETTPLRTRSLVGLLPLIAVEVIEEKTLERFPQFSKRMKWFLENRRDLLRASMFASESGVNGRRMLAIPTRARLEKLLRYLLDENEFLAPYGLRSVSKAHESNPYLFKLDAHEYDVRYVPGEGTSGAFGGNSNWRGPIWFPMNFLIIEALERYHHFFGDSLQVEYPMHSGRLLNLKEVSQELAKRLSSLFVEEQPDKVPAAFADYEKYKSDPNFDGLCLFPEYFHGDNGRGLGAMHQTGWTALIVNFIFTSVGRASSS